MFMSEFGAPEVRFGEPRRTPTHLGGGLEFALRRRVTIVGQWTLSIEQCQWEVMVGDDCLAHSESDELTLRGALRVIDGQALVAVDTDSSTAITRFEFDLGAVLTVRPYDSSPGIEGPNLMWNLRTPANLHLAVRDDRTFSLSSGESSPHDDEWRPVCAD